MSAPGMREWLRAFRSGGGRRSATDVGLVLGIPFFAAAFARASANSIVAFPTLTVPVGNGWSRFHVPLLGFVLAGLCAAVSARRLRLRLSRAVLWAGLAFGVTHMVAVLAFQWGQGFYDTVLGGPFTPRLYLILGNLYIVILLIGTAALTTWLMIHVAADDAFVGSVMTPASNLQDAKLLLIGSVVGLPFVSLLVLASRSLWLLAAAVLLTWSGGLWLNRGWRAVRPRRRWVEQLSNRITAITRREVVLVGGLIALSFGVRYYWGRHLLASTGSEFLRASDDGLAYDEFARKLATGVMPPLASASYWGGTLYWYFLALVYRIWGIGNFVAVICVQAGLGVIVPVATYFIAREVLDSKRLAVAAGIICALNVMLIFLSGVIGMEALFVPLFYAGFVWLMRSLANARASTLSYLGVGTLFGLANMARNELFGYPFLLVLIAAVFAVRCYRSANDVSTATHGVRMMIVLCLGFGLVWTVQGLFNLAFYEHFTFPSAQASMSFVRGTFGINENPLLDSMGFNPFRDAAGAARVFIAHPRAVASLLVSGFVKRLYTFLILPNSGIFDPLAMTTSGRIHDVFPAVQVSFSSLIESYEILLGLLGVVAFLFFERNRPMQTAALLGLLAYSSFLNAFIDAKSARHRAILVPVLTLCLMKGVEILLSKFRTHERSYLESDGKVRSA